jgi:hypothetical protein
MNFGEAKALATYLRTILIAGRREENILIYIISELSGFKVTELKLCLLNLLDKVVSMSDRILLLGKVLSIFAVLPTSSCERILIL